MQLPHLSKSAGELLRRIGPGRRLEYIDITLTLSYGVGAGDGLIVHAQVLGQAVRLWLAPDQWCRWISPMLEVPSWSSVPPELHDVLASWTLASASTELEGSTIAWPTATSIEAAAVETAPCWCLRIEYGGRQLDVSILEAPLAWLESLADVFDGIEVADNSDRRTIPVALIAGWSRVDQLTLNRLKPGDGLLLQQSYRTADGELGLFMNRPLATLSAHDAPTFTLKAVMEDFNDWLDIIPVASESNSPLCPDLLLTVVVQVASIEVPLHQLANLRVGDVLEGPAHVEDCAILKVAGRTIAHGLLLDIDGRLAVRIDRLV